MSKAKILGGITFEFSTFDKFKSPYCWNMGMCNLSISFVSDIRNLSVLRSVTKQKFDSCYFKNLWFFFFFDFVWNSRNKYTLVVYPMWKYIVLQKVQVVPKCCYFARYGRKVDFNLNYNLIKNGQIFFRIWLEICLQLLTDF